MLETLKNTMCCFLCVFLYKFSHLLENCENQCFPAFLAHFIQTNTFSVFSSAIWSQTANKLWSMATGLNRVHDWPNCYNSFHLGPTPGAIWGVCLSLQIAPKCVLVFTCTSLFLLDCLWGLLSWSGSSLGALRVHVSSFGWFWAPFGVHLGPLVATWCLVGPL